MPSSPANASTDQDSADNTTSKALPAEDLLHNTTALPDEVLHRARLSRDPRFDGRFFIAVVTTGVFCRPICPARLPREDNVRYYDSALQARQAGYRPCLRCRPDGAPGRLEKNRGQDVLERAMTLIDQGALDEQSVDALAARLDIGARHLRHQFQRHLGITPLGYAQHRRCLLAKQLLHESTLSIANIAMASGFNSVRRFNQVFHDRIGLRPSDIRRKARRDDARLQLTLSYRPPYAFADLRDFLARRAINGLEWASEDRIGRHFLWQGSRGTFTAVHQPQRHAFMVELQLDSLIRLSSLIANLRRVLDLDATPGLITEALHKAAPELARQGLLTEGLRIPGLWSPFEAAVRAVLGQQVSVSQARQLTQRLVDELGESTVDGGRHFPTASAVAASSLAFLRMPDSRRQALRRLATAAKSTEHRARPWQELHGIGEWTAGYARLRGEGDPDVWLASDAVIRRVLGTTSNAQHATSQRLASIDLSASHHLNMDDARPWRSYLLLQLWRHDHAEARNAHAS